MELLTNTTGPMGTWEREAHGVTLLAADLGLTLDEEALILADVRDLMSLQLRLQEARRRMLGTVNLEPLAPALLTPTPPRRRPSLLPRYARRLRQ